MVQKLLNLNTFRLLISRIFHPALGSGTKIEFFTDQGETIRNEYLCPNELKTVFRYFVTLTDFIPQSGPAWLADFAEPADWAKLWTRDRSRYKKSETSFEVLA